VATNNPSYVDLIELARICMRQARAAQSKTVAAELRKMAVDYRRRAAAMDGERPAVNLSALMRGA